MKARSWLWVGLLVAAPAWALPPVQLSLGYSAQVFSSRSYDLVSSNDTLQSVRLAAGYSFELSRGAIEAEVAYQTGGSDDRTHGGYSANFELRSLEAGVSYRYPLFSHLEPYVHLGAAVDWATLSLATTQLTQTVMGGSGNALIGAQIPFKLGPDGSRAPWLLMDLGIGYVLRPVAGFHAMQPGLTNHTDDPIAHGTTDVGRLPLSGVQYRVLLTFRL
jgi:hypothetical protein